MDSGSRPMFLGHSGPAVPPWVGFTLAYNLGKLPSRAGATQSVKYKSLTKLRENLAKIGAKDRRPRAVRHLSVGEAAILLESSGPSFAEFHD